MAAAQGTCRFCGQQILVEDGEGMTEPQRDECATLHCECDDAKVYQEAALRRDTAKRRVDELFGEGAGEHRQPDEVIGEIKSAVDLICDKKAKNMTLTIRTGLKCRIMQMAKDKIKVVREMSDITTRKKCFGFMNILNTWTTHGCYSRQRKTHTERSKHCSKSMKEWE